MNKMFQVHRSIIAGQPLISIWSSEGGWLLIICGAQEAEVSPGSSYVC
jgi:hypothetical protein